MWEVACNPRLNYGSEVWACSSQSDERRLEQIQERGGVMGGLFKCTEG